jgi:threonine dehydrogenase-like Zn-dependent dehydrogenase
MARTNNRGPDSCIDAVGCEAAGHGAADAVLDKVKAAVLLATARIHVLREAIMCCRKGGTISIPGVYVGVADKLPIGAAMNKGLTFKMGQTHVQAYTIIRPTSKQPPRCTRNSATRRTASSRW